MISQVVAEGIWSNWENGNRSDVRNTMKKKSKLFALDLVHYAVEVRRYDAKTAVYEVYKMCE